MPYVDILANQVSGFPQCVITAIARVVDSEMTHIMLNDEDMRSLLGALADELPEVSFTVVLGLVCACARGCFPIITRVFACVGPSTDTSLSRFTLSALCQYGRLDIARWLVASRRLSGVDASMDDDHALRLACENGHSDVAKWLKAEFWLSPKNARAVDNYALRMACANGHLELAKWLVAEFWLNTEDARSADGYALRLACDNGHLETAKWLTVCFGLTAEDARIADDYALRRACTNGHLETAKWLAETFYAQNCDFPLVSIFALCSACENGHLEMVMWLVKAAEYTADRFRKICQAYPLFLACRMGHGAVAGFLIERFSLDRADINESRALAGACRGGRQPLAEWLVAKFGLTVDDVQVGNNQALQAAYGGTHYETAEWLIRTFYAKDKPLTCEVLQYYRTLMTWQYNARSNLRYVSQETS